MPREATKADRQTLIEQGTEFKGTMKSSCPVVVNGRIEGELSAPELEVTQTGTVQGTIKAERLSSRGVLSGNIDAGDLFLSGSVGSKTVIKARNLEVKLTPDHGRMEVTFGECTLDVGDEPSKERRLDASSAKGASGQPTSVDPAVSRISEPPPKPADVLAGKEPIGVLAEGSDTKTGDGPKSVKPAAAISKPPPKKNGARDSVPPGA